MKGFRVYDKDVGKYVTDELYWLVDSNGELNALADGDLIGFPHCVKEDETGLTDKNGKKIFEGDIISVTTIDEKEERLADIRYGEFYDYNADDLFLGWYICVEDECISLLQDDKEILKICKIIGNIHDNPELLEE